MRITNVAIAIVVAFLYVGSIHYKVPREIRGKDRNDPMMILFRLKRVSLACLTIVVIIPFIMVLMGDYGTYMAVIKQLGLVLGWWSMRSTDDELVNIAKCATLICCLYLGVIVKYLIDINFSIKTALNDFYDECCSIYGFRDYLFAPFTEELVYRAVILVVLKPAFSQKMVILFSPLLFGISHIHHGYELYMVRQYDLSTVLISVLFQTTYTNVFGILENYLFFKYNSIWGCTIIHTICNMLGFPDITVDGPPIKKIIYYITLVFGIILFYHHL